MTFIIVLIALVLERFFHWHQLRQWRWLVNYAVWVSAQLANWPAFLILAAIILPLLLVAAVLQSLLANEGWWVFRFIFSMLILLYCLGSENLWVQTYRCINELNKENPAAIAYVQTAFQMTATDNLPAFHQTFVRTILIAVQQRIFAVLFWFVLLGPVGAILYRLIESVRMQAMPGGKAVLQIKGVLDWLPIRLLAFLFALGGHFTAAFSCWKRGVFQGISTNEQFLTDCGIAALDMLEGDCLAAKGTVAQEALALIDRVLLIGLVILAVVVLLN
jgi:AmpE protein